MKRLIAVSTVALVLLISGCSGGSSGSDAENQASGKCELPNNLTRLNGLPVGVLMPSGSFQQQSYKSASEIVAARLNAVSFGWSFYYTDSGEIVFDFDGSNDEEAKSRWINQIRCSVIEAKEAGLIVSVWGQFQEANYRGEPMGIPEEIRNRVLDQSVELIPEIAKTLEELKVEYWSPVSELDKYAGIDGHNAYFPKMVDVGRPLFNGIIYSQPNILQRDSFFVQNIQPNLGKIDALGISWISYECEPERLRASDFFLESAKSQGINDFFVSELGSTNYADETNKACLEKLIEYWGAAETGLFLLDNPPMREGVATIKDSWQEGVLVKVLVEE